MFLYLSNKNKMVIKNILIISLIIIILLSVGIWAIVPNPGHSADEILITFDDTYTMTLQESINENFLKDEATSPTTSITTNLLVGHGSEDIKVYVGGKMTLQEAINTRTTTTSFCREGSDIWTSITKFFGHSADKIEIIINDIQMDFQEAINSAQFCSYSWEYTDFGDCPTGTCRDASTLYRTSTCMRSDGTNMGNPSSLCIATQEVLTKECSADTSGCCGDGTCDSARSETCSTCAADCGACCVPNTGGWSDPAWTPAVCPTACGSAASTQTRTKVCNNPTPNECGVDCSGAAIETSPCGATDACCTEGPYNCRYTGKDYCYKSGNNWIYKRNGAYSWSIGSPPDGCIYGTVCGNYHHTMNDGTEILEICDYTCCS